MTTLAGVQTMTTDDTAHMAHICRVVRLEDAAASLLREFNAERLQAGEKPATGLSVELDASGHWDVTYMDGAFPLAGEGA